MCSSKYKIYVHDKSAKSAGLNTNCLLLTIKVENTCVFDQIEIGSKISLPNIIPKSCIDRCVIVRWFHDCGIYAPFLLANFLSALLFLFAYYQYQYLFEVALI